MILMALHAAKKAKEFNNSLTKTSVLLALALSFQIGLMPLAQPAVGPLVNMTLLIAVMVVGPGRALMIGCVTPLMAFMLGIMPLPFLVPVVMMGNAAFILTYHYLSRKMSKPSQIFALLAGSFAKFFLMAGMIRAISHLFMPSMPAKLIQAFSLPQFYTAMLGGVMALMLIRYIPRSIDISEWKSRRSF